MLKRPYDLSGLMELDNADVMKQFMTSLPHKWLFYTIIIRRTKNLYTFTPEEVYETLQNYEFESGQLQENNVPIIHLIGALLVALMVKTVSEGPPVI
ncbi:hypothetical protein L1987_80322 [Smallanthus sonchifolius]|uniref:Uncharacterized protein n=1 Tax=Smallanthus sonchifolius TaxID=185202 RepID=A0ACB8YM98_9ASTR|nr:hypothetical protein L1987_80322 [Smallanthus sonchifolius]